MTTATEELDHRSYDQLATCDKTSEQKMKTVQKKPKFRIEDAELTAWPQLKPAYGAAYSRFYNFLLKCESATYEQNWNTIHTQKIMCLVLSKLPGISREKWNRTVLNIRRRHLREPDFADLIHFVDDEATVANDPLFSKDALSAYVDRKEAPSKRRLCKTYLTTAKGKIGKSKHVCYLCQNNHDLDKYQEYMKKSVKERSKFLFQRKLCYGCYMPISTDHNSRSCKQRKMCDTRELVYMVIKVVRKTKMQMVAKSQKSNSILACATTKLKSKVVSMCVVPVNVKCNNSKIEFTTHGMLDCCSQGTFISSDLARKLKAEGVQTNIKIKTLNGEESQETEAVSGLKVSKSSGERMWIDLPVTYTKEDLPVDDEDVAIPEKIRKWKYLERITGEITQGQCISIGLLLVAIAQRI